MDVVDIMSLEWWCNFYRILIKMEESGSANELSLSMSGWKLKQ